MQTNETYPKRLKTQDPALCHGNSGRLPYWTNPPDSADRPAGARGLAPGRELDDRLEAEMEYGLRPMRMIKNGFSPRHPIHLGHPATALPALPADSLLTG